MDDIDRQIIALVAKKKKLQPEQVTIDATFKDLGIDSLDGMDLLFSFEDTFNLSIPDDVAQQMKSVRQVSDALHAALAKRAAATE